jgi:hypothetical protein
MHGQPTIKNGTLPLAKKAQNFFMTAVKEWNRCKEGQDKWRRENWKRALLSIDMLGSSFQAFAVLL